MKAETAYHVFLALSETERDRLFAMLERDRKPVLPKKEKNNNEIKVWTLEEATEWALAHFKMKPHTYNRTSSNKLTPLQVVRD